MQVNMLNICKGLLSSEVEDQFCLSAGDLIE